MPKAWDVRSEQRTFHEALEQVELAEWMRPLREDEIPVIAASRAKAEVNQATLDR